MRQHMWVKFLNDSNFDLKYHPCMDNKMDDALSMKVMHTEELMMLKHNLLERFINHDL